MDIYITTVHDFLDLPGMELASPAAHDRIAASDDPLIKARVLAAALLMRQVLGDDALAKIEHDEYGKPFIQGGPYFNISRSGDYTVLAATDYGDIGVDVEQIRPFEDDEAQKYFVENELAWLNSRSNKEQAFSSLWTGKQSVMKATGLGTRLHPASFSILPLGRQWRIHGGSSWFLNWRRMNGHMLCVSAMRPESLSLKRLERGELTGNMPDA